MTYIINGNTYRFKLEYPSAEKAKIACNFMIANGMQAIYVGVFVYYN